MSFLATMPVKSQQLYYKNDPMGAQYYRFEIDTLMI